jgi:hypothetical protein
MIFLNIHGFRNDDRLPVYKNSTYDFLFKNYPKSFIDSPGNNHFEDNPYNILNHYINTININYPKERIVILAKSLGGFFGYSLNYKFPNITTILFNPALEPYLNLKNVFGVPSHIVDKYFELFVNNVYPRDHFLGNLHVFIGDNDNVISHDYVTKNILPKDFKNIHTISAGHEIDIFSIEKEIKNIIKKVPVKNNHEIDDTITII